METMEQSKYINEYEFMNTCMIKKQQKSVQSFTKYGNIENIFFYYSFIYLFFKYFFPTLPLPLFTAADRMIHN